MRALGPATARSANDDRRQPIVVQERAVAADDRARASARGTRADAAPTTVSDDGLEVGPWAADAARPPGAVAARSAPSGGSTPLADSA